MKCVKNVIDQSEENILKIAKKAVDIASDKQATDILLNKETESKAFENALSAFKDKSLINYGTFTDLP